MAQEGGAVCGTEREYLFQAIAVSGSHGQGSIPEPGTLKQKKMLKQLERLLLDSGFKMEH